MCIAKYRRLVITDEVDRVLREICIEIKKRYEICFLEIGAEGDHVHFLIQEKSPLQTDGVFRTLLKKSWQNLSLQR